MHPLSINERVSYPPRQWDRPQVSNRQSFSTRLASATVCFISFKRARSGFDRLQLLTIHSFMNHECMNSCGHFSYGDLRYTRSHWMGVSLSLTVHRLVSVDDSTVVQLGPLLDTKLFSLSRSIWLCYLEVSVEEGKLAKGWCVTV
jgi:hypothetical protein